MNKLCDICGKEYATETHHLLFGKGIRRIADADNKTTDLCFRCHKELHYRGTSQMLSKMLGQALWEIDALNDGVDQHEVRQKFRERYGRSWL